MTALIPVEVTLRHDDTDIVVRLLGEPTSNPDLVLVPDINRYTGGTDDEEPRYTSWTVQHMPSGMGVIGASFELDDARAFAEGIAHLDWADFRRADTRAERAAHPYARVVKAALNGVTWW